MRFAGSERGNYGRRLGPVAGRVGGEGTIRLKKEREQRRGRFVADVPFHNGWRSEISLANPPFPQLLSLFRLCHFGRHAGNCHHYRPYLNFPMVLLSPLQHSHRVQVHVHRYSLSFPLPLSRSVFVFLP